jgi:hypothetical protein
LFAIVHRILGWDLRQPLNPAKKPLIATLRDEIRQPDQQPLRLTIPREERLARVADALLEAVPRRHRQNKMEFALRPFSFLQAFATKSSSLSITSANLQPSQFVVEIRESCV